MSDVTVVQTPKGHTTIHYKGNLLATISGAGRTREDRLKLANTMADALTHEDDNSIPVNGVEARKALEEISKIAEDWRSHAPTWASALDSILDLATKALAATPRNCDVGSEKEQSRRYEAFCEVHHMQCDKVCSSCPCSKKSGVSCELYWAQMPYEPQEGGAE